MDKVSFHGRNPDIVKAYRIVHKINTCFPAVCPWKMNVLAEKYKRDDLVGAPVFQEKLCLIRDYIIPDNNSDYNYATKNLEAIKQFKTANCKEFSELGYLIARTNNIKNCYCANIYAKISDNVPELKNFKHAVLLITPQKIKNVEFADKYYVEEATITNSIIPDNKTIIIDCVTGIIDYWKNAIKKYSGTVLNDISSEKEIRVRIRQPLLCNDKDFQQLKKEYPILNFENKSNKILLRHNFSEIKYDYKNFKKYCPELFTKTYPAEKQSCIQKFVNIIKYQFSLLID